MCTVTFIPRKTGYLVGMNRDEKLTRVKGVPPSERLVDGRRVIYPSEPSGGTWLSLNDAGVTFALINWYSVPPNPNERSISRGDIIPTICAALTAQTVGRRLLAFPLQCIRPFRLIGLFKSPRQIKEWQWDLKTLIEIDHDWKPRQWISSGFDEPTAQALRGQEFTRFLTHDSAGTPRWLRRLHRSHNPVRGPFSTCMHREDACTVSYTEVSVRNETLSAKHCCGSLCDAGCKSSSENQMRIAELAS